MQMSATEKGRTCILHWLSKACTSYFITRKGVFDSFWDFCFSDKGKKTEKFGYIK
jgi:hypothetical protein